MSSLENSVAELNDLTKRFPQGMFFSREVILSHLNYPLSAKEQEDGSFVLSTPYHEVLFNQYKDSCLYSPQIVGI
jgi:hypothetical protein